MIYSHTLEIPASTTQTDPLTHELLLPHGIIHRLLVGFPPGPNTLAHLQIFRADHQIWPSDPDQDFAWAEHVMDWPEWYEVEGVPYSVSLRGWNTSTRFTHRVWVAVGVLPRQSLQGPSGGMHVLRKLDRLLFGGV